MAGKNAVAIKKMNITADKKRFYRKNVEFFRLVEKIRLWPSRSGVLHGIKSIKENGDMAEITTHCGETFLVRNSRNSRADRWLRNKWCAAACTKCAVPEWKIEKYTKTMMTQKWGAGL